MIIKIIIRIFANKLWVLLIVHQIHQYRLVDKIFLFDITLAKLYQENYLV